MPTSNGMLTAVWDSAGLTLTNAAFEAMLQLDPVETFCAGDSGNAMSIPEWMTTFINFLTFALVVGGVILAIGVGILGWGADKLSAKSGGGGKKYVFVGVVMILAGAVVFTIPQISGQAYTGAEQCFAMIQPAIEADALFRYE